MIRFSPSPKVGLSVALGLLLASVSGTAGAARGFANASASSPQFDLIAPERSAELPAELRAQNASPSPAAALGFADAVGSHKLQLHWVVREHGDLSGYRVTLVAADGLPGNLAARWFVATAAGVPVGDGLTSYSTELSLTLDEPAPVAAAVEAVDLAGHTVLLGVRRSIAEAEPMSRQVCAAGADLLAAGPTVLQASRFAPTARAATGSTASYPSFAPARLAALPATLPANLEPGGAVSPRGPPTETVTT